MVYYSSSKGIQYVLLDSKDTRAPDTHVIHRYTDRQNTHAYKMMMMMKVNRSKAKFLTTGRCHPYQGGCSLLIIWLRKFPAGVPRLALWLITDAVMWTIIINHCKHMAPPFFCDSHRASETEPQGNIWVESCLVGTCTVTVICCALVHLLRRSYSYLNWWHEAI